MSTKAQDVNEISHDPRIPSRPNFYRNIAQLPTRVDVSSTEHGSRKAHGSKKQLNLVKSIPKKQDTGTDEVPWLKGIQRRILSYGRLTPSPLAVSSVRTKLLRTTIKLAVYITALVIQVVFRIQR